MTDRPHAQVTLPADERLRNFRRWFGGSKVLDDDGKPLVVYHGTSRDFTEFKRGRWPGTINDIGHWFANDAETAGAFGNRTMPVYLRMERPLYIDSEGEFLALWKMHAVGNDRYQGGDTERLRAWLRARGHDGLSISAYELDTFAKGVYLVVLDPTQIKSAIGNSGRFDPHSTSLVDTDESPAEAAIAEFTLNRRARRP